VYIIIVQSKIIELIIKFIFLPLIVIVTSDLVLVDVRFNFHVGVMQ